MIKITVQGYLTLKELVGRRQISLPAGSSLQDGLAYLGQNMGERFEVGGHINAGELREHIIVMLNGVHCRHLPEGLGTILKDGDQIAIFPPLAGG